MHSLVKFVSRAAVEEQTQTCETNPNDDNERMGQPRISETTQEVNRSTENSQDSGVRTRSTHSDSPVVVMGPNDHNRAQQSVTCDEPESTRYSNRLRRKPSHLEDFVDGYSDINWVHTTINYCYRAICGVQQTFGEAMRSANSKELVKAMDCQQARKQWGVNRSTPSNVTSTKQGL